MRVKFVRNTRKCVQLRRNSRTAKLLQQVFAAPRGNGDIRQSMKNDGWRKASFEIRQRAGRAYGGFITSWRQQRGHVFFTKLDERVERNTRGELRVWGTSGG